MAKVKTIVMYWNGGLQWPLQMHSTQSIVSLKEKIESAEDKWNSIIYTNGIVTEEIRDKDQKVVAIKTTNFEYLLNIDNILWLVDLTTADVKITKLDTVEKKEEPIDIKAGKDLEKKETNEDTKA